MTLALDRAVIYDVESFPNCFTLTACALHDVNTMHTWEISAFRDDSASLYAWCDMLARDQVPMIGFNNVHYDYVILHTFLNECTLMSSAEIAEWLYRKTQAVIMYGEHFAHTIWERDRFIPQIDLFKINHFDNRAKTTSLKALQIAMRSPNVVDMPVQVGTVLTREQIDNLLIPYNRHDVRETHRFAHYIRKAIDFRAGLIGEFGPDVLNYNDTKIGAKLLERRLGRGITHDVNNQIRQTVRHRVALADVIFPYVRFNNPEFQRVLDFMRAQVLTPDDLVDPDGPVRTKGVFTGLKASVAGLDYHFGTGGIHGSLASQRVSADDQYAIVDIDVESLYPSIGIVNRLAPEHLGETFVHHYAELKRERLSHKKGTVQNASLKLALNGTYGNTANRFSVFLDCQYTMAITINGQLMLCMLAEWLLTVPDLTILQINTDGITVRIRRDREPQMQHVCSQWEQYTCLKLEHARYSRMWLGDVNNYIAEYEGTCKLKCKGRFMAPPAGDGYADAISEASPPGWHRDYSALVSIRAAVDHMVKGLPLEATIYTCADPYDFMIRAKVDRSSRLMLGDTELQRTSRYYIAVNGAPLRKISPPVAGAIEGSWKRKNGITEREWITVRQELTAAGTPDAWDARIHTANKSKYVTRETAFDAGYLCAECNDVQSFDWSRLNYQYYVDRARRLVI